MPIRHLLIAAMLMLKVGSAAALSNPDPSVFLSDLDTVQGVFETQYAPKQWKFTYAGLDFPAEVAKVKARVQSGEIQTVRQYQRALKSLLLTTQDYHVGVTFVGTEKSTLPLDIRSAEGRYFLAHIDRNLLPLTSFPFEVGDEVLELDGRPVADIAAELEAAMGSNTPETRKSMAEYYLTRRSARGGWVVPRGPILIKVLPRGQQAGQAKAFTRQLIWNHTPERLRYNLPFPALKDGLNELKKISMHSSFYKEVMAAAPSEKLNPHAIGGRDSFVPDLGELTWSGTSSTFKAYIFKTPEGKSVGYVRIPSYGGSEAESLEFQDIISHYRNETDGLVIDQVSNPGGSVFYLYGLVAVLTDQAFMTPRHRMSLNHKDVMASIEMADEVAKIADDNTARSAFGRSLDGYLTDFNVAQFFLNYLRGKVDYWNQGLKVTEPLFLGVDYINPHPLINYTKPILLLTNELDFSGGDFFPAILQDNKRVTIMGTRTAGAGGYVQEIQYPNQLGVASISLTASIAERVNKNPIENLGVQPDIPYSFTVRDLQEGFVDYKAKVLETLKTIL